ncbi:MAG: GOLPH3/VPS74 family protein [Anaerolineae bacterium]
MFILAEELFLLALDDESGWIAASVMDTLRFGLTAALLADLALQGKIVVEERRVLLRDPGATGDDLLDWALQRIRDADRPFKLKYWINALSFRKLPRQIAERLAERGVLREEERRYHSVIEETAEPSPRAPARYWIKERLRRAVLTTAGAEQRTLVLLSLLQGCRLLNLAFTKDERKAAGKRIGELVQGEDFGAALAQTLEDIERILLKASVKDR